ARRHARNRGAFAGAAVQSRRSCLRGSRRRSAHRRLRARRRTAERRCGHRGSPPSGTHLFRRSASRTRSLGVRSLKPSLRTATADDLPGVLALLREASLPEDIEPHFASFVVAEAADEVIGAVGLELLGSSALLRSLVVAPEWRNAGVGSSLTKSAINQACARSIEKLFLLTTEAALFF